MAKEFSADFHEWLARSAADFNATLGRSDGQSVLQVLVEKLVNHALHMRDFRFSLAEEHSDWKTWPAVRVGVRHSSDALGSNVYAGEELQAFVCIEASMVAVDFGYFDAQHAEWFAVLCAEPTDTDEWVRRRWRHYKNENERERGSVLADMLKGYYSVETAILIGLLCSGVSQSAVKAAVAAAFGDTERAEHFQSVLDVGDSNLGQFLDRAATGGGYGYVITVDDEFLHISDFGEGPVPYVWLDEATAELFGSRLPGEWSLEPMGFRRLNRFLRTAAANGVQYVASEAVKPADPETRLVDIHEYIVRLQRQTDSVDDFLGVKRNSGG